MVKTKKKTKNDKELKCKICGNSRSIVRKYNLNVCKRCFKDHAEEFGFEKLD